MPENSQDLHEDPQVLSPEILDRHRAIASLMEEMEAVDWYDQRVQAASDPELKRILGHNRDEEKEHAAMVLEWLRRRDPKLDGYLREYLFTSESVVEIEEIEEKVDEKEAGEAMETDGSLGIGSLVESP